MTPEQREQAIEAAARAIQGEISGIPWGQQSEAEHNWYRRWGTAAVDAVLPLVEQAPLFTLGEFTMHSGAIGKWKIDCDALTDTDIACLAAMLAERVEPFGYVEGIPRGGLRLAAAMAQYATAPTLGVLVVDDVCTTGASFDAFWKERKDSEYAIQGAVLFARGPCPSWVTPLFSMGLVEQVTEYEQIGFIDRKRRLYFRRTLRFVADDDFEPVYRRVRKP